MGHLLGRRCEISMACFKFKSPFTRTDSCEKTRVDCLADKLSVNEEYSEALRTKSYAEMLDKVENQLGRKSIDHHELASSSNSLPFHVHLSDYLLEPRQETLAEAMEGANLHHLLIDYFKTSFEACNTCELLLGSIHRARANYRIINRVISLSTNTQSHPPFQELASFATLNNPLLIISPSQFQDIHDSHGFLFHRLTMKFKRVRRRAKMMRFCKKILGFSLVVSYSVIIVALLVLVVHSVVGIFATPWLACLLGLAKKRVKVITRGLKGSVLERLGSQLEVAAKGVFVLINEFDTMSRLVRRLQDEIEDGKAIADMCVRKGGSEVLMEVVKEFRTHQVFFLEQLEELEEHIYLCFLTINRSRTLVMQEIMMLQQEHR
ncbi:transmembrane protein [Actinidia rufa]|uniref:Transmembrane protein n=1 Tax=Actinidia rufa TaxID=165716 RepID=A0A7J0GI45_9ERIC|nr:transmembrane protein [Actinidia rufa]